MASRHPVPEPTGRLEFRPVRDREDLVAEGTLDARGRADLASGRTAREAAEKHDDIGVLPAHRGKGYIDDILAAGTRVPAGQQVPRIRAATDLADVPMARAFARTGYMTFERAITFVRDAPGVAGS